MLLGRTTLSGFWHQIPLSPVKMLKTWYVVHFLVQRDIPVPPRYRGFSGFLASVPRISGLFTAPSCLSAHSFLVPGGRDASRMVWVGLWSLHGCLGDHFDAPPATGSLNWYPPGCSGRCHGHRMQRAWEGCLSWEAFHLVFHFPTRCSPLPGLCSCIPACSG